jgi:ADP-heptose:LPS heptosyltransferase
VRPDDIRQVVSRLSAVGAGEALVLTSFHQNALPTALLLRLAGIARIAAVSDDYPGSLLDVRIPSPGDAPEPERMLTVARAAGYALPPGDTGRLAVLPTAEPPGLPDGRIVVLHPGTDAPARAYPEAQWRALAAAVAAAAPAAVDLGGRLDLAALAATLRRAEAVVVGNTGPAHLAAAVGTPVVSLFAPTVPTVRWAPYGAPRAVLGDQQAACRGSRARECPVAGHPCLSSVTTGDILAALERLAPVHEGAA